MQPTATKTYTCIFPKVQSVGTKCFRALYFTFAGYRRKYLSALSSEMQLWAEISASASYLLMHDMGGNFRLHFLHNCKMWLEISVSILLNDGDHRQKILSSFS